MLSEAQLSSFQQDGFLVCTDIFSSDEHLELSRWVDEVAQWENGERGCAQYREMTAQGATLARTERFLAGHEGLRELIEAGRLIQLMSQLFGEPALAFKEKINYKQPGGAGFAPHQDAAAYHNFGSLHITALVPIDPNTEANGCLSFAPGQHRKGLLPLNDVGCLSTEYADQLEWQATPSEPGSVLFFSSYAPHKSASNRSTRSRRSLYVTYGKASEGNLREKYYDDREQVINDHRNENENSSRISTIGHFQGKTID